MTQTVKLLPVFLLVFMSCIALPTLIPAQPASVDEFLDVSFRQKGAFIDDIQIHELIVKGDRNARVAAIEKIRELPLRIAILMDASGSQRSFIRENYEFYAKLIALLPLRAIDSACLIFFNENINVVQDMTSDKTLLLKGIDPQRYWGPTKLSDAVFNVSKTFPNQPDSRRAMIIITDGEDNYSEHKTKEAINEAIANNIRIYFFIQEGKLGFSRYSINTDSVMKTGGKVFPFRDIKSGLDGAAQIFDELNHLVRVKLTGVIQVEERSSLKLSVSRKGVKAFYHSTLK